MSYKLGFTNKEFEPYTGLEDENEIYYALQEEAEKVVDELSFDIFTPIWADGTAEIPYNSQDDYAPDEWERMVEEAEERGKKHAVTSLTVEARDALWNMALDEEPQRHKFPDGTVVILSIEKED